MGQKKDESFKNRKKDSKVKVVESSDGYCVIDDPFLSLPHIELPLPALMRDSLRFGQSCVAILNIYDFGTAMSARLVWKKREQLRDECLKRWGLMARLAALS
jgi:hypothetical protein